MKYIALFLITLTVFLTLDMIWLGVVAKNFYRQKLSFIFTGEVNWTAALVFYAIYVLGILYFAVYPGLLSGNWKLVCINGSILGLLCYATYDLTNLATIKQWPFKVVWVDILWGTLLTGSVALLSYFIVSYFFKFK